MNNCFQPRAQQALSGQSSAFLTGAVPLSGKSGDKPCIQIDERLCREWTDPNFDDKEMRNNQLTISKNALFHNTLVCLPTGLGKTFIAAVVMYNFYR